MKLKKEKKKKSKDIEHFDAEYIQSVDHGRFAMVQAVESLNKGATLEMYFLPDCGMGSLTKYVKGWTLNEKWDLGYVLYYGLNFEGLSFGDDFRENQIGGTIVFLRRFNTKISS